MNQEQFELEFADNNAHTGFRLRRLEVLNWGTFDKKIWKITSDGDNLLLTGDIGSGKSTMVDALTTLLVPHNKITFNKAAGSEKRERTLYSYIKGEYKTEKNIDTNSSKSIYLRNDNADDYCGYSVLLGSFYNDGFNQWVNLAQVFWLKDDKPQKMFIISTESLGISNNFQGFGDNMGQLRKKLKDTRGVEIFDSFKDYNMKFRHLFGIKSEKALDLFYQTVSMKSVGNLTEFVRNQMLEKTEVATLIDNLKKNFYNLVKAHDAVEKANKQMEELTPLMEVADKYEEKNSELLKVKSTDSAVVPFFAQKSIGLFEDEIEKFKDRITILEKEIIELGASLEKSRDKKTELKIAIQNDRVGQRIGELEKEIQQAEESKNKKLKDYKEYSHLCELLDYGKKPSSEDFYQLLKRAKKDHEGIGAKIEQLRKDRDDLAIKRGGLEKEDLELENELESLKKRETSISKQSLDIREKITQALNISEDEIPFAGELIQVKETENHWEGAIERLLHNFALSLLVPESLYKRVSNFVNKTNLKGRLVFYRVKEDLESQDRKIESQSLFNKVEIKADSDFYPWLENQLKNRFDYYCCETMEEFFHRSSAITREGQIKGKKYRHEKDDRRSIHDRSHFVLGWSNKNKIKALESSLVDKKTELSKTIINIADNEKNSNEINKKGQNYALFLRFKDYNEIDWQKEAEKVQRLTEEKKELSESSDRLKKLNEQLVETEGEIESLENKEKKTLLKKGSCETKLQDMGNKRDNAREKLDNLEKEKQEEFFPVIENILKGKEVELENIGELFKGVKTYIEDKRNSLENRIRVLSTKTIKGMNQYNSNYPEETTEVEADIESIGEYKRFLIKIKEDDLPRYRDRFRDLLKERTIKDIAIFNQKLEQLSEDIEEKIDEINKSLRMIEYNEGTYITLQAELVKDVEIRDFKLKLRSCFEGTFQDDKYSEQKFEQVKEILDRFNNDTNWTEKVTDVRNWYGFMAIERWQEDDSDKEVYSSSSGKSGGQKEKLAYTILASALAYQFGLKWNEVKSKSFRFVVIDEAFGRGSDESTRYGLELFKKLDLQLLIVTPLQKIYIIEDYISSINFVSNPGGKNSQVRTLTMKEYREKKKELEQETVLC